MTIKTNIDHLVIGARNLQQGVDYVRDTLGVEIPFGGIHPKMGTHNHLMKLGERLFLEVIAINPDGAPPCRPRWFAQDDPYIRTVLSTQPGLLTWVINCTDIHTLMADSPFDFGTVKAISRGELRWLFGVPDDGRLLAGGMLPYIMQWQTALHPAQKMHDNGCHLASLELHHSNQSWLASILDSIGIRSSIELHPLPANQAPYLLANIDTPSGIKQLSTLL